MLDMTDVVNLASYAGPSKDQVGALKTIYTAEELNGIMLALDYAVANPGFDFKSLLADFDFSNLEILDYLRKCRAAILEHAG